MSARRALGAAAVAVAAIAAAPSRAADLELWASGPQTEVAAIRDVVAAFNARQGAARPHFKVVAHAFDGFADRVAGAARRGQGPDVLMYPQDRLGGWVHAGGIVAPLDPAAAATLRDRFSPQAIDAVTVNQAVYGAPYTLKLIALFYNRKLVASPPGTTAELLEQARRLTDRARGTYGLAYRYTEFYYHAALQNGFGGRVLDDQLQPVLDSDENVRALSLLLRWREAFLPEEPPSRESIAELFDAGRAAMVLEGPWFRPGKAIDYRVAPLPRISEADGRPMRPWMSVEALFVGHRCRDVAATLDLLRYMTDVEAARAVARAGYLPTNQKAYLDPVVTGNATLSAFAEQARVAVPMPNAAEMTVLWSPATAALGAVARDRATPRDALTRAQALVTKAVADLRQPR